MVQKILGKKFRLSGTGVSISPDRSAEERKKFGHYFPNNGKAHKHQFFQRGRVVTRIFYIKIFIIEEGDRETGGGFSLENRSSELSY